MEYDTDKVDEDVLALLYLVSFRERKEEAWRAWKGQDWDVMERLHQKGFIFRPEKQEQVRLVVGRWICEIEGAV